MNDKLLLGKEEICRYLGENVNLMTKLIEEGLKAWKRSERSSWKAYKSDCDDFLEQQRDRCLSIK